MSNRVTRNFARLFERLHERTEQDIADRDPQEAVRVPKSVPETATVSDTVTVTERAAADTQLSFASDGPPYAEGEF